MPVKFQNFSHSFNIKAKPVFVPSERGYLIGRDIKQQVNERYDFPTFYYHLQSGGHVAALHAHRENRFFCKIDIDSFFYRISRNRVTRALKDIGVARSLHYAKWSCVKSPLAPPAFALPYGFVQSPILASLVLSKSVLGDWLREKSQHLCVAVYVDDISLSGKNLDVLQEAYNELHQMAAASNFPLNLRKSVAPTALLEVFNCTLRLGATTVDAKRITAFHALDPNDASIDAFERYCATVAEGNL